MLDQVGIPNLESHLLIQLDNTATSSINKLVNDFIFYFEKGYRANKIGILAGVFSDNPLPDRVEAYYGKIIQKFWLLKLQRLSIIFSMVEV